MLSSPLYLNPAEAARRLGVSAKALRLYEQRGLLRPARTAAGWRAYGAEAMARGEQIAALRRLGLSLAEVGRVLAGDAATLEQALAEHQAGVDAQLRTLATTAGQLRDLRAHLATGQLPPLAELSRLVAAEPAIGVSFELPWPWGGERFELNGLAPLTFIIGPLGSGKTRLAQRLATELPGAIFVGLDRAADGAEAMLAGLDADLRAMADLLLDRLQADGAAGSDVLLAIAIALAQSQGRIVVLDLIEHGLDAATQAAVGDLLRQRRGGLPPLLVMTRSTAILDLADIRPDTGLLLCPANHSPPMLVAPHPGAAGYEALASCLASPEVRARTDGAVVSMSAAQAG